jgi:hypothetical protein
VPASVRDDLSRTAFCAGLTLDVAGTLLVEWQLAIEFLESLGLASDAGAEALERGRPIEHPQLALSAAEADYLRSLTIGRRTECGATPPAAVAPGPGQAALFALPVRLVSRAGPNLLIRAAAADLAQAIAAEIAALRAGMTMGEWIVASALATQTGA